MPSLASLLLLKLFVCLATCTPSPVSSGRQHVARSGAPTVNVVNGTYYGVRNEAYNQEFFLGMPYAQAPTGCLRFAAPQPLATSFSEPRSATEYSDMCIGYGADTENIDGQVSEDCLKINVIRPAGVSEGDELPVSVWIHGGSYVMGSSSDPRYNLTWIVEQSVKEGKPMIATSINYRLDHWGFLFSKEMQEAGAGNLGFRDQRMALRWLRDNIAGFGGSPAKVTLWGESAGARSVGVQLVAYGGRHDGLFRGAILESGSPVAPYAGAAAWQPYFDALAEETGCAGAGDRLACLRALPWQVLDAIFNSSAALDVAAPSPGAVVDGDFITAQGAELLARGGFAPVPLLLGNNVDEGTAYAAPGVNTTQQFLDFVSRRGVGYLEAAAGVAAVYPDDPAVGVPASFAGRPPAYPFGRQWKRVAAFAGDFQQHGGRRLTARSFAAGGVPVYSYLWNVLVHNGLAAEYGATHFQEVAFAFNNTRGLGYAVDPFEGKPETLKDLANMMSRMWVSFIHDGNPNLDGCKHSLAAAPCRKWPRYTVEHPHNIVFDVNVTGLSYTAVDDYREIAIDWLLVNLLGEPKCPPVPGPIGWPSLRREAMVSPSNPKGPKPPAGPKPGPPPI
ncbi:Alpha/Beta hydrolase protein [Xylariomycetidae sp. FL0641]|nr:Alpha/Beta hydrolase protein [Xylariomycetidae sp. FL0641]